MSNNYQKGDRDTRPWGTWEVLDENDIIRYEDSYGRAGK